MGKVFTAEEIASGQVPEHGAHQKAADYIMRTLFGPADTDNPPVPTLTGGLPFGSVQLGTPGPRSDLDILFSYEADRDNTALRAIRSTISAATTQFKVPIGAKTLYEGSLDNPLEHDIDIDFAHHLQLVARQGRPDWLRGKPLPEDLIEKCSAYSLLEYAVFYCSFKTRAISRKMVVAPQNGESLFQEVLELPDAICRKALPAVLTPEEYTEFSYTASKRTVLQRTVDWATSQRREQVTHNLQHLAGINSEYSQVLSQTLEGQRELADYHE